MARAYSQDLRDRVIDAVLREGMSRRAASVRFEVSESSAIKWVQRVERLGDRQSAGTGGHRPSKIKPHHDWVFRVIEAEKDITLAALATRMADELGVTVDTGMLSRFFQGEGISFKKKRAAERARSA
jgi:transposase